MYIKDNTKARLKLSHRKQSKSKVPKCLIPLRKHFVSAIEKPRAVTYDEELVSLWRDKLAAKTSEALMQ